MYAWFIVLLLTASTFIVGDALQISRTACDESLGAEASRRFAYDLYAKAVQEKGGEANIFLAPTTVSSALGMVLLGANGTTKDQLWEGLKLGSTSRTFTEDDFPCLLPTYDVEDEVLAMRSAQRLFGEKTFDFDKDFVTKTSYFGANMEEVDFAGKPQPSRKYINKWVSNATDQKIPHLFAKDDITSDTVLAITSAIYFKGLWGTSFNRMDGRLPFDMGTRRIKIRYMTMVGRFRNKRSAELGASLLELPYKSSGAGYEVSMIVVLPNPRSSMNETEAKVSEATLTPAIKDLLHAFTTRVRVLLPKFKIRGDYDLRPILTSMGMGDIFNQHAADFSGMRNRSSSDNRNLYVGSAVHKTFLKVDEKGTEAAGASGVSLAARSHILSFFCSRPYMIVIYEKTAERILFIGKVNNPIRKST